jgi:hypothetical protein
MPLPTAPHSSAHDDADAPFFAPPPAGPDAEWGKASLATGGVLLVAGFPGILLIAVLAMNWTRLVAASDTKLMAVIGYVGFGLGLLTAVFGVVSAVRAWIGAARHARTAAWAVSGLLVGVLAVMVWGIALFSWHKCVEDVQRQQRQSIKQLQIEIPGR